MKLYGSLVSPFVRKVRVLALEIGLELDFEVMAPTPVSPIQALIDKNPLGKVPLLELDDGSSLYDSRVISEYLDSLHAGPPRLPAGPERWQVLRRQALGDGLIDAGVVVRYETFLRPEPLRWPDWIDSQLDKIHSSLGVIEAEVPDFGPLPDLGQIAIAVGLEWLAFRQILAMHHQGPIGLESYPQLHDWYRAFCQRPAMLATRPA